jgi:hypothetical protein
MSSLGRPQNKLVPHNFYGFLIFQLTVFEKSFSKIHILLRQLNRVAVYICPIFLLQNIYKVHYPTHYLLDDYSSAIPVYQWTHFCFWLVCWFAAAQSLHAIILPKNSQTSCKG